MDLSCDMVPDEETEGFAFTWEIQNFRYCLLKKSVLISPSFKLNLHDANEWCLRLLTISDMMLDEISLFLFLLSNDSIPIKVKLCFSVRDINGNFKRRRNSIFSSVYKEGGLGFSCFLNHDELFNNGDNTFLKDDTLTLRCRILQEYPEMPVLGLCHARTEFEVERVAFVWSMDNFKEILQNEKKSYTFTSAWSAIPYFTLLSTLSDVNGEKHLKIQIKYSEAPKNMLWTWIIALLDTEGRKVGQSPLRRHWCEDPQETQMLMDITLMPVKKILKNEKRLLINGALSFWCECKVFSGEEYSTREKTEYGIILKRDSTQSDKTLGTRNPRTRIYNLELFNNKGKFSNLIIRTASSKAFPVHKAILCARSEVLRTKFEHETKDNQTGVLDIEDFNDDTVYNMLLFAYTDKVEDLEWKTALELYSAADKYRILDLKKVCHNVLIAKMNTSNVCEILLKAHMLQDKDMKSAAEDFMWRQGSEFIVSEYWLRFRRENLDLANETLKVLCTKSSNRILSL